LLDDTDADADPDAEGSVPKSELPAASFIDNAERKGETGGNTAERERGRA
jgi:hypothetical protein